MRKNRVGVSAQRPEAAPSARLGAVVVALLLALAACGDVKPLEGEASTGVHPNGWKQVGHQAELRTTDHEFEPCYGCHPTEAPMGDAEVDGAPPCTECHKGGPDGCDVCHAIPPAPHRAHVRFDCTTCHVVPKALHDEGHREDRGVDDVRFGGPATARDFAPTFDGETCTNTACHAGPGAATPAPKWTPTALDCGDCHGKPPPVHVPDRCDRCHGAVISADEQISNVELHVNGEIDALDWRTFECGGCHGEGERAVPPPALSGATETNDRGVGAHSAHLAPANAAPVACETCHIVPEIPDFPGHVDDDTPGAEVVFSDRAIAPEGEVPSFAPGPGQCASTACHGDDRPFWTGDAPCGTCHALPPAGHVDSRCDRCHLTAGPERTIAVAATHVDGLVDVDTLADDACESCHAEGGRVPLGGSHEAHASFDCARCHVVPETPVADGHLDGRIDFDLASGTVFEGTCSGAPCHGRTNTPVWGEPESVPECGSCHGEPPPEHSVGDCALCHPAEGHLNGTIDFALPDDCGACHAASPETGAHAAHLSGGGVTAPVPCETCHVVPVDPADPGHFGPPPGDVVLATGQRVDGRCADTRCHAAGGAHPAPAWDDGPDVVDCDGCHGFPPSSHPPLDDCSLCHIGLVDAENNITDPIRHINGEVDVW